MATAVSLMELEELLMGSGLKINSTVLAKKLGSMEKLSLAVSTSRDKKKEKVVTNGPMAVIMKENSTIINFLAMVCIISQNLRELMKETLKIMYLKARVSLLLKMVANTKVLFMRV